MPSEGMAIGGMESRAWLLAHRLARFDDLEIHFVCYGERRLTRKQLRKLSPEPVNVIIRGDRWRRRRSLVADRWQHRRKLNEPFSTQATRWTQWACLVVALAVTYPFRKRDLGPMQVDDFLQTLPADIFVGFGGNRQTGQLVATASAAQKPVLWSVASNADLQQDSQGTDSTTNRYGDRQDELRFIIERANCIVAQTAAQQKRLASLGRRSIMIRNPIDLTFWHPPIRRMDATQEASYSCGETVPRVLWIGRAETVTKRIDLAIAIAASCPSLQFTMVSHSEKDAAGDDLLKELPPNVRHLTKQTPEQMRQLYHDCTALLVTNRASGEGFPNVLLQAAATGLPIVSMDDFDSFIVASGAGVVSGPNLDRLSQTLRETAQSVRKGPSVATRNYLQQFHDADVAAATLRRLALNVVGEGDSPEGIATENLGQVS